MGDLIFYIAKKISEISLTLKLENNLKNYWLFFDKSLVTISYGISTIVFVTVDDYMKVRISEIFILNV